MDSKTLTPITSASQDAAARPATPIAAPATTPRAQHAPLRPPTPAPVATQGGVQLAVADAADAAGRAWAPQAAESLARGATTLAPAPPSRVRRSLALLLGSVLLVAICAVLLAPLLLALVGGAWAAVMEVRTVAAIWALARHQDYGAIFTHLDTLDTASRVAFLSVSFFALLFALMLLMAGLLGRRWARLFIVPGLVFTAPTLVCYVVGWLWLAPVAARHGVSSLAQTSLAAYMLLDAVVLAAALCDMRPTLRRARRVARLGKRTRPSLPAIRLAGRGGLATAQVWREPVAPNVRRASPTLQPTAPTDLMADVYGERPRAHPSPRFALQAPITRPMAAIRIEDVAPMKPSADAERDEFADSAEAETWRIFSGEWAAWGADDVALHQTVTLPALGWPDDEAPETDVASAPDEMATTISASEREAEVVEANVAGTADMIGIVARPQDELIANVAEPAYAGMAAPVYDEVVVELAQERMTPPDETLVAPPPVHLPITETVALAALVINETTEYGASERVGVQAALDTPLGLAPV